MLSQPKQHRILKGVRHTGATAIQAAQSHVTATAMHNGETAIAQLGQRDPAVAVFFAVNGANDGFDIIQAEGRKGNLGLRRGGIGFVEMLCADAAAGSWVPPQFAPVTGYSLAISARICSRVVSILIRISFSQGSVEPHKPPRHTTLQPCRP